MVSSAISFEYIGVLDLYFISIIIKYRSRNAPIINRVMALDLKVGFRSISYERFDGI